MKINIYDEKLNLISSIDNRFVSCLWSEGYNTIGDLVLELQSTEEMRNKLRPDYFIGRSDRKTVMAIGTVLINDNKVIVYGKTAGVLLRDTALNGVINSSEGLDISIKKAYNNSDNKNELLGFSDTNLGVIYNGQISYKTFDEVCRMASQRTGLGFKVERNNGKLLASFYLKDNTPKTVFAEQYNNLSLNQIVMSNAISKNYAIVIGKGGTQAVVDWTNGNKRKDIIINAGNIEGQANLEEIGVKALLDNIALQGCSLYVPNEELGVKYDLGDTIWVLFPNSNIKFKTQITKFAQKEQNNALITTIDVGQITAKR